MSRLPVVSASDLVKILLKHGFCVVRQKGNHIVVQKRLPDTTITTVVPNHRELAPGTLRSILKKTGLSIADFVQLLAILLAASPPSWGS